MKIRSKKLRFLVGVLAGALCSSLGASEWLYTVRPGDTLWDVVDRYAVNLAYVDRLQSLNEVTDPRRLDIGSILRVPVAWLRKQPAAVEVIEISGNVSVTRHQQSGASTPQPGDRLRSGDSIATSPTGNALLRFADGSTMRLRGASSVAFDALSVFGDTGMVDTRARLQRGRVNVEVNPFRGAASRYEIETPSATTAVRGTGYRISVDDESRSTRTEVLEGTVDVANAAGQQGVEGGFGVVVDAERAPAPPRPLLDAPDLADMAALVDRVPVALDWQTLAGASGYRVQVSRADDFNALMVDRVTDTAAVRNINLPGDGDYFLRIRGLDDAGLEGFDAVHRFALDAFPQPPFPQSPAHGEVVRTSQPDFLWSRPVDAAAYVFELATDPSFDSLLVSRELTGQPAYRPERPLSPGDYFWRVATRDARGELGPRGDVQSLTYVPPPPAPAPEPAQLDTDELVLKWPAGLAGQSYLIQLSRDPEFSTLQLEETLAQPAYRMPRPKRGTYYYRVATVDSDGTTGPFSTPQTFDVPFRHLSEVVFGAISFLMLLL